MPRDGVLGPLDGLLDRDDVLGRNLRIAKQPVPNMLLLDGLRHDDCQAAREFGLAAGGCYRPFDGSEFCHGSEDTQPPLCSQQQPLLGSAQRKLYIQGMTYGQRLKQAMEYAGLNQPDLAKRVREMMLSEKIVAKAIGQQTVSRALGSSRSAYTSWFARACGVSAVWLESEIGEMVQSNVTAIGARLFITFDESRVLRLKPNQKKRLEKMIVNMLDDFEEDNNGQPDKKKPRKLG